MNECSRRKWLQLGGAAAFAGTALPRRLGAQEFPPPVTTTPVFPYNDRSPVSLVKGDDRRKNVTQALLAVDREIGPALKRKKYVAIKVNNVTGNNQLAATHVDALRGILDYLEPRFKGEVMIVESSMGDSMEAFEFYKYAQVIPEYKQFNIKLVDLNREAKYETFGIIDNNIRPVPVRLAARLLDPDAYIISSAMLKTHDNVVATMTVKNMAMGAPLRGTTEGQPRGWSDKSLMHAFGARGGGGGGRGGMQGRGGVPGAGAAPAGVAPGRGAAPASRGARFHAMNYNLAIVAKRLSTAWGCGVIDGWEGMEGNGPIRGTAVPVGVALASPDLVAVDRVGLDVMGVPHHAVGYLQYAAGLGVGQFDISKIDIRGERPESVQKKFRLQDSVQQQLDWLNDIARQG